MVPEPEERGIQRKRDIAHVWESERKRQRNRERESEREKEREDETHAFLTVTNGSCPVWCQNLQRERTRERERLRMYVSQRGGEGERKRDARVSDCDSWLLSCVVPEPRERGIQRKGEIAHV